MSSRLVAATLLLLSGMLLAVFPVTGTGIGPFEAVAAQSTPIIGESSLDEQNRTLIEATIDPDTGRGVIRLPAVWTNESGELSVVVALRERDDLDAFRAAAQEDVFKIMRAVYTEPDNPITSTTVVGTYSVTGTGNPRELPILRVVLSAP